MDETAFIISAISKKHGGLQNIVSQWCTASIVPVYKSGEPGDLEIYGPIALLSHGRKIVESAIFMMLNNTYLKTKSQLGFQQITGIEIAKPDT